MKHYYPDDNITHMMECYNKVVVEFCECAGYVKAHCDLESEERKLRELLISRFDALRRVSDDGSRVAEDFLKELALQRETQDARVAAEQARKLARQALDRYNGAVESNRVAREIAKRDYMDNHGGREPVGEAWCPPPSVDPGEKPTDPDSIEIPEVVPVSDKTFAAFSRLFAEQSDIVGEIVSIWDRWSDAKFRVCSTENELVNNLDTLTAEAKDNHNFYASLERDRLAAEEAARLRRQDELKSIDLQMRDLQKRRESLAGSAV